MISSSFYILWLFFQLFEYTVKPICKKEVQQIPQVIIVAIEIMHWKFYFIGKYKEYIIFKLGPKLIN
jgi:hypothetical protein